MKEGVKMQACEGVHICMSVVCQYNNGALNDEVKYLMVTEWYPE
jgi:hypothetical protein